MLDMSMVAIVLYGSHARGSADMESDLDILIVTPDGAPEAAGADVCPGIPLDCASWYSWSELKSMHQTGSLFLLHLQREGRVLYADSQASALYHRLVSNLPPYQRVDRDLSAFSAAIDDVEIALTSDNSSVEFELASVATVIRHASILGCYLGGDPEFGRYSAVARTVRLANLDPGVLSDFKELYAYRLAQDGRRHGPSVPTGEVVARWIQVARRVIRAVMELSYARS